MSKPLFKYIGGKTWLKKDLQKSLNILLLKNNHINKYCEPFCGGLGSFLSNAPTLLKFNILDIYLSDINNCLIQTYIDVQKNPQLLIYEFLLLEKNFSQLVPNNWKSLEKIQLKVQLESANSFFKKIRTQYNTLKQKPSIITSAMFIFLQKHSFNGIYRENSKGDYNTPFNWSGQYSYNIADDIKSLNLILSQFNITFQTQSFENITYVKDCLYYLDPPYINLDINENKYNKDSFTSELQLLLIEKIKDSPFIYSNHSTSNLLEIFNNIPNTEINTVFRKNIISSDKFNRNQEKAEVLVSHWL